MVSFTTLCLTIAATAVATANAHTNPCRYPYDNCGWVLANGFYGKFFFPSLCSPLLFLFSSVLAKHCLKVANTH